MVSLTAVIGEELVVGEAPGAQPLARSLSNAEADRLASMRAHNWHEPRAGLTATIYREGSPSQLAGWVDWQRPLVYLAQSDADRSGAQELIQAVPGLVAHRAIDRRPEPGGTAGARPPVVPPAGDWRLRTLGAASDAATASDPGTIDALVALLLTLAAPEPDSAQLLAASQARWLRRDRTAGREVDVLLGPAAPPSRPVAGQPELAAPGGQPLAAMGGAVEYWLDEAGWLHRFEAVLDAQTTVRVDLDRSEPIAPVALDVLGGAAIEPRPVTDAEAQTLAQLPLRNREAGGGEVRLWLPGEGGENIRATGWLDWQRPVTYLATYRNGAPDGLVWADGSGLSTRADRAPKRGFPPVPAVFGDGGWHWSPWEARGDELGGFDLDLLLHEALGATGWQPRDPAQLRELAVHLRTDQHAGDPVSVYEIPHPIESELAPGQARLRYWVAEASGGLVRLEIRTRAGGFGHLDISIGPLPYLG